MRRETSRIRKGIAIVGVGNWGSSLAAAVVAAGIPLAELVVRKAPRRRLEGLVPVFLGKAKLDAEVIWICVPDGEIAPVVAGITACRGNLSGQTVVHSSGALTVEVLAAAQRAGARVGGIAPVFSFPTREPVGLDGAMFAVEVGAETRAGLWRQLAGLVRKLGGRPLRIASDQKVWYHAAATMASPLLVSALQAAVEAARLAGLNSTEALAVVEVLAAATLRNFFAEGAERSFSGAFARGDAGTVELHLRALVKHPMLHGLYRTLAENAVASLPVRNRLELERVLGAGSSNRGRRVRE